MPRTAPAVVRQLFDELLSSPSVEPGRVAELVADGYVLRDDAHPDGAHGPAALLASIQRAHRAFPGLGFNIDEQVAHGNLVITHWHSLSTNAGKRAGLSAGPPHVTHRGRRLSWVTDGRLVAEQMHWETLDLLRSTAEAAIWSAVEEPAVSAGVVRRPTGAQLDAAGQVLARAFHDDPMYQYAVPDPVRRAAVLTAYCAAVARYGHLFGELHAVGMPLAAVAVWAPPSAGEMDAEQVAASGFAPATGAMTVAERGRLLAVAAHLRELRRQVVPWPHWYLMMVGVEPDTQGHGVGARVLRPVLTRADAEGVVCALETTQPRNLSFYARLGFEVVAEGTAPASDLRFWLMERLSAHQ
jgi:GNAT superfamily N-acetyltransferase